MKIHVLPGDSLLSQFPKSIDGEKIICRECLIVGDLKDETLADFWQTREAFLASEYGEIIQVKKAADEFEKLEGKSKNTEINLWFEYELFCQTNYWFTLYLLQLKGFERIYRVNPIIREGNGKWNGFGNLTESDLEKCYEERFRLSDEDIANGAKLWLAYKSANFNKLKELSKYESSAFLFLEEVCQAEIQRKLDRRVEKSLLEIIENGAKTFSEVFVQFQVKEGVYGFGDSQVKSIYEQLIKNKSL